MQQENKFSKFMLRLGMTAYVGLALLTLFSAAIYIRIGPAPSAQPVEVPAPDVGGISGAAGSGVGTANFWKIVNGSFVVPGSASWTIGSSTVDAQFNDVTISGTCTGCPGGGGAGSGTVATSSAVTANHFPYWTSDGFLNGTSTITRDSSGNISVSGAINASSTLSVENATDLRSTLSVSGVSSLAGVTFTNATGTGNLQVATLNTTGAATFAGAVRASSTLEVTGSTTLVNVSSTQLTVSGNTNLATLQTSGAATLNSLSLTTDLSVANGGTGASTLTGLLQGNGTSAFTAITDSSTGGQVLRVTGASTYGWGALDLDDSDAITGTLGSSNIEDLFLLLAGDTSAGDYTWTGANDFGGATSIEIPNGAGGTTVNAAGEITIDTTSRSLNFYDGTAERVLAASSSKSWAIESPATTDKFGGVFFDHPVTIRKVACVNKSSGDNVTFNFGFGANRASSTSILFTSGGLACNSASSTTFGVSFNDATVDANSWIWPTFVSASSTEVDLTVYYTIDP